MKEKSRSKYVSTFLVLMFAFASTPQYALAQAAEYSPTTGGQYIAQKAYNPEESSEDNSVVILPDESGFYHSPLSPVDSNSDMEIQDNEQILNEAERTQVENLVLLLENIVFDEVLREKSEESEVGVVSRVLEKISFKSVYQNSYQGGLMVSDSSSVDSSGLWIVDSQKETNRSERIFIDSFIPGNYSSLPRISERTQDLAQKVGFQDADIITIVDVWSRIVDFVKTLMEGSDRQQGASVSMHNRESSQGEGVAITQHAIAPNSNLVYGENTAMGLEFDGDLAEGQVMTSVLIDEQLAAAHAFLNPPKNMHPYMRYLFYSRHITPEMQQNYSKTVDKIKKIYERAKKEGLSLRYGKEILRNYFLPMPDDMGGLYEVVTKAMEV